MSEIRELLAAHRFTDEFPDELIDELAEDAIGIVRWQPGQVIFREGQPADRCFLIILGDVALEIHSPGREPKIIQTVNADEVLGWSWIFTPYRWAFDARALTATEAIALDGAKLREGGGRHTRPDFCCLLMGRFARLIVDRLQATRLQLMDVYGRSD